MPRPKTTTPKYCHDRWANRAYVTIDGRKIVLGVYDSPESREKYHRLLGEWAASGYRRSAGLGAPADDGRPSVNDVIAAFWSFAKQAYPAPPCADGKRPAGELGMYWDVLRLLRRAYGATPAEEFGPKRLMAVREQMIRPRTVTHPDGGTREEAAWCRTHTNRQVSRLKRVFGWAVEQEIVPGEVHYRLSAVKGLARGRSAARESDPVKPVPQAYVDAVLPYVSRQVAAMIRLQLKTGMRPGEVCNLRTCDVDRSGPIWVYRPPQHKTAYLGHVRDVRIGREGQELLAPFLKPELAAFCFSPAEAEAERAERRRRQRKTPARPWEHRQDKARLAASGRRRGGRDRYDPRSYRRAIVRACEKAHREAQKVGGTVLPWTSNQLRHNAATLIRRLYGLEASRVVLGHRSSSTTEIYAEQDFGKADQIMAEIG